MKKATYIVITAAVVLAAALLLTGAAAAATDEVNPVNDTPTTVVLPAEAHQPFPFLAELTEATLGIGQTEISTFVGGVNEALMNKFPMTIIAVLIPAQEMFLDMITAVRNQAEILLA